MRFKMAQYKCPIQQQIDGLQAYADRLKDEACKRLFDRGWSVFYYGQGATKLVAINLSVNDYDVEALSKLNYSKQIISFCEQNIEEDDYVVF